MCDGGEEPDAALRAPAQPSRPAASRGAACTGLRPRCGTHSRPVGSSLWSRCCRCGRRQRPRCGRRETLAAGRRRARAAAVAAAAVGRRSGRSASIVDRNSSARLARPGGSRRARGALTPGSVPLSTRAGPALHRAAVGALWQRRGALRPRDRRADTEHHEGMPSALLSRGGRGNVAQTTTTTELQDGRGAAQEHRHGRQRQGPLRRRAHGSSQRDAAAGLGAAVNVEGLPSIGEGLPLP